MKIIQSLCKIAILNHCRIVMELLRNKVVKLSKKYYFILYFEESDLEASDEAKRSWPLGQAQTITNKVL